MNIDFQCEINDVSSKNQNYNIITNRCTDLDEFRILQGHR